MKPRPRQSVPHSATPIQVPPSPRERLAGFLETLAFTLLLACVVARPFMAEMSFRTSAISASGVQSAAGNGGGAEHAIADKSELSRVTFALGLLLAGVVWLSAGAVRGGIRIHHGWLVAAWLIFAALSLASAETASNRRWALTAWIEQVSLIGAGLLAMQLCRDRRRFVMVLVVLSAIAGTMAVKGLWEYFVEIPANIEDFQAHRAERLAQLGFGPDSPQATAFENRLRDTAPIGFIALANPLASLLLVTAMAAAGLAFDKLRQARASAGRGERNWSSDIPMPVIAAIVLFPLAIAAMVVLFLTRSRGGIISLIVALVLGAAILLRGEFFRRHWKKLLLSVAGLFIAGAAAVAIYGITQDRLPTKTMTFRWFYWKGSAQIAREHPLLGVGPANFSTAYLKHREGRAEEAVKNPHNLPMHCLAEYGVPGAIVYFVIIGAFIVLLCRPARLSPADELSALPLPQHSAPLTLPAGLVAGAAAIAAVLVARITFGGVWNDPEAILYGGFVPAAVMFVMLVIAWWAARDLTGSPAGLRASRVALGVACGAFVLHDMVNFALFMPATAAIFWLAAGAAAAQGGAPPGTQRLGVARTLELTSYKASVAAVIAFALVAIAAWTLWLPVAKRTDQMQAMVDSLHAKDAAALVQHARQGANADDLDGVSAADAAKALALACPTEGPQKIRCLQESYQWAQKAISRDRENPSWRRLAGGAAGRLSLTLSTTQPDTATTQACLEHYAMAVQLDPQNARQRVEYAQWLLKFGRHRQALEQLQAATLTDHTLLPESGERFTPAEQKQIDGLLK